MTIGSIPELINAVAILVVAMFVVYVLVKLGKLIDRYKEEIDKK